jgi:putative ABC transport system substrate-binding protein
MRRREFITLIGGVAAWPIAARAQQSEPMRRIGVLQASDENDPEQKHRLSAFSQALAELGWADGRDVRMDLRWGRGDNNRIRALAQELVGLRPEIILVSSTAATAAVQRETRTIPTVFVNVAEPVASGFVPGLNQPGGNITGFAANEATLGGKWLELLSEIAPALKRAAIMFNPNTAPVSTYMSAFETAARSLKVTLISAPVHSDVEIETAIIALGREPGGGLVVTPDVFASVHRASIISAATRNNVPAVYWQSPFARDGGLLAYGVDQVDTWRRAATGVSYFINELGSKRLELLHELVPAATAIGVLINPTNLTAQSETSDVQAAARVLGLRLLVENASSEREIDAAFARFVQQRVNVLHVASDGFFTARRDQLAALAARHALPASYGVRNNVAAGGLMSYGASATAAYRQAGVYTGRILKGEKPSDLPVMQPTKFEFVINLKTAQALGLDVPAKLLALADEVLE